MGYTENNLLYICQYIIDLEITCVASCIVLRVDISIIENFAGSLTSRALKWHKPGLSNSSL